MSKPSSIRPGSRSTHLEMSSRHLAAARPVYERALITGEKILGPEHPEVGQILYNLAELLRMGDYDGAQPLYSRAIAIYEKALGPEHPNVARSLSGLANLLSDTGDYDTAGSHYRRALAIQEEALGAEHPDVVETLSGYADLLQKMGRDAEAEEMGARIQVLRGNAVEASQPR